jgi:hypothetical protein
VRYLSSNPIYAFAEGARGSHNPDAKTSTCVVGGAAVIGLACLAIGGKMRK